MEIFTLLETIEDMLENSKEIPFTHKAMLDKEELSQQKFQYPALFVIE